MSSNSKASSYLLALESKIPNNSRFILQQALQNIPKEQVANLLAGVKLKDPVAGLILGICLGIFGVDRFYKGDIVLGILKLFVCLLCCLPPSESGVFGFISIWALFDLFFVYQGIEEDNFQKIMQAIQISK